MKLNTKSYVHVKVRKLCQLLSYYTDMELTTDLSSNFNRLEFKNKLSYLIIDYEKNLCFAMSHKITRQEQEIIEEIMIYLDWLRVVGQYISS